MKLTKKQKVDFFNCHEGVGILAMKTKDDEVAIVNFFIDKHGEIKYLTDFRPSPKLDLNEFVKERGWEIGANK